MIHIIFTGGTIGSCLNADGSVSTDERSYKLLSLYREKIGELEATTECPFNVLSENIDFDRIEELLKCISNAIKEKNPSGIIITHGTDTLHYSSSFVGHAFAGADIPIVMVSANYILEDPRSNGLVNFANAVDFIKNGGEKGVFVSYKNEDSGPQIHRATKLCKPLEYSDSLYSLKEFTGNNSERVLPLYVESLDIMSTKSKLVYIMPYVGMRYPKLTGEEKAVLFGSFHSGTIRTDSELMTFTEECRANGVKMYLAGHKGGGTEYETIRKCRELGINVLDDETEISMFARLTLIISAGLDFEEFM